MAMGSPGPGGDEADRRFLQRAIALAVASVAEGGGPFGAVVARHGIAIAESANRVTLRNDPTAHAEVEALRRAGAAAGRPELEDAVLYASCEPCPMCLAAALWARVPRIVFAASHEAAARAGFDDTAFAQQLYGQPRPVQLQQIAIAQMPLAEATAPFDAWLAKEDRRPY